MAELGHYQAYTQLAKEYSFLHLGRAGYMVFTDFSSGSPIASIEVARGIHRVDGETVCYPRVHAGPYPTMEEAIAWAQGYNAGSEK